MKLIMKRKHFEMTASSLTGLSVMLFEEYTSDKIRQDFMIELFSTGKVGDEFNFINKAISVTYDKKQKEVTIEIDPEKVDIFYDTINENIDAITTIIGLFANTYKSFICTVERVIKGICGKFTKLTESRIKEKETKEIKRMIDLIQEAMSDDCVNEKLRKITGLGDNDEYIFEDDRIFIGRGTKMDKDVKEVIGYNHPSMWKVKEEVIVSGVYNIVIQILNEDIMSEYVSEE